MKKRFNHQLTIKLLLFLLLLVAAALRFYNLNWDNGHFFHPDERNIANAVSQLELFTQLDPKFYAYGGFLIYLYKISADIVGNIVNQPFLAQDWTYINLIGRYYSALFSTITLIPLFLLTKRLFTIKTAFITSILYTFTVSSIQTAHFSITENLLTFILITIVSISLQLFETPSLRKVLLLGVLVGIATATKTTGTIFALIPAITFFLLLFQKKLKISNAILYSGVLFIVALGTFILFSPYTFLNWEKFTESMRFENSVVLGTNPVVYTLQFTNTIPYFFQIKNLFWQVGPVMLFSIIGTILLLGRILRKRELSLLLVAIFPFIYFGYVGSWHTKFIRYMVPLIPFFLIAAGYALTLLLKKWKRVGVGITTFFILLTVLWALAFFSIYTREQTRITASKWIYSHIPFGSYILTEHWDEGMPIPLPENSPVSYRQTSVEIYNPDDEYKLRYYAQTLSEGDYISITTRRLYGTLLYLDNKYPLTSQYYKKLFKGELGYTKIAEFSSYPQLFGIVINDDLSEETFQVYDHPKVMIYQNTKKFSSDTLYNILRDSL